MKEFLFLYRADFTAMSQRTPEELAESNKAWFTWITGIAEQNNLVDRGRQLDASGRIVKSDNVITNGPYTEIKETLGGYSVVKADSYDAAAEIAKGCPVLYIGGKVEVRELIPMQG